MASHSVAAGEYGAWEQTLTAATVDTVTFTDDLQGFEVINEGTVGLYVRVGGTAPVVGEKASIYVPPGSARSVPAIEGGGTVVKLISSGTPKYSVSRVI